MNYTFLLNNHPNKHILTKGNAKSRLVEIIHRFSVKKLLVEPFMKTTILG